MIIIRYIILFVLIATYAHTKEPKKIIYLVSDTGVPYWSIMYKGIKQKAKTLGYNIEVYSADNLKKKELENTVKALSEDIDGLVLSPINSFTAATILDFAKKADVPVVISDIGAESEDYVSFISSNNEQGAYGIGKVLTSKMKQLGLDKSGTVGIIAIPQKRENGKARTKGFMKALKEANIEGAGIFQQVDFSYEETYRYTKQLIKNNQNLKAIWLQGSNRYQASLDAIKDLDKENKILLICFDAEPEFLELIPKGILVGSAMQQPYLMGQKAVETLDKYINGQNVVKYQKLDILAISEENIENNLKLIKRNVLGMER